MYENEVSVIVPVYKVENYIEKCVRSIQNQTLKNIEIILIDDGSPDESIKIVEKLKTYDKRIKIIRKQNEGASSARNSGLEVANGKYIVFVDSDDYIDPNYLEEMYNTMELNNLDICVSGIIIDFCEEGYEKIRGVSEFVVGYDKDAIGKIVFDLDKLEIINYIWNNMYKASVIKENNIIFGVNDMPAEDLIFNCRIFQAVKSLGVTDKAYYHYMRRNVETVVSKFDPNLFNKVEYFNRFRIELYKYFNLSNEIHQNTLYNHCFKYYKICILDLFRPSCKYAKFEKYKMIGNVLNSKEFNYYFPSFAENSLFAKGLRMVLKINSIKLIYFYCNLLMKARYKLVYIYKILRKRKNRYEKNWVI